MKYATERVATRTGPNNARSIVWAICDFFSLLFFVYVSKVFFFFFLSILGFCDLSMYFLLILNHNELFHRKRRKSSKTETELCKYQILYCTYFYCKHFCKYSKKGCFEMLGKSKGCSCHVVCM